MFLAALAPEREGTDGYLAGLRISELEMVEAAPDKPETSIRVASQLSYITGIGTLLSIGPGLAYNLQTGSSTGALLGMPPSFGDFLGSPIGIEWGFVGVLVFGLIFLSAAVWSTVAGCWLWKSLKKGGRVGAVAGPGIIVCAIGFVLPAWLVVVPVTLVLLALGWKTLR